MYLYIYIYIYTHILYIYIYIHIITGSAPAEIHRSSRAGSAGRPPGCPSLEISPRTK